MLITPFTRSRSRLTGSELTGPFRTHLRYLEAFARIATGGEWKPSGAYRNIAKRFSDPELPRIQSKVGDVVQVHRSLQNAWSTELLLLLSHRLLKGDEVVRVSNNWNVVQAYYALYHAMQAILVARGYDRPDSHSKTQKMSLLKIVSTSLYASELLLCTAPNGRKSLCEWAQRWVAANVPKDMARGLPERLQHWG
jgi:hypothetical protein